MSIIFEGAGSNELRAISDAFDSDEVHDIMSGEVFNHFSQSTRDWFWSYLAGEIDEMIAEGNKKQKRNSKMPITPLTEKTAASKRASIDPYEAMNRLMQIQSQVRDGLNGMIDIINQIDPNDADAGLGGLDIEWVVEAAGGLEKVKDELESIGSMWDTQM